MLDEIPIEMDNTLGQPPVGRLLRFNPVSNLKPIKQSEINRLKTISALNGALRVLSDLFKQESAAPYDYENEEILRLPERKP